MHLRKDILAFETKSLVEKLINTRVKNLLLKVDIKLPFLIKSVSTIPDECMGVGLEIGTSDVLGNEASENRSGRLRRNPAKA